MMMMMVTLGIISTSCTEDFKGVQLSDIIDTLLNLNRNTVIHFL